MKSLNQSNYLFLALSFIAIGLLLAISLVHFEQINNKNNQMLEQDWLKSETAHALDIQNRKSGSMLMEMLIASEPLQLDAILPRMQGMQTALDKSFATLSAASNDNAEKELLRSIGNASIRYMASFEKARQLISQGHKGEATLLINYETLPLLDATQEPVLSLIELQQKRLSDGRLAISDSVQAARTELLIVSTIAVLATLLAAVLVAQQPSQGKDAAYQELPLKDIVQPTDHGTRIDRNWRTAPAAFNSGDTPVAVHCTLERKRTSHADGQRTGAKPQPEIIDIIARTSAANGKGMESARLIAWQGTAVPARPLAQARSATAGAQENASSHAATQNGGTASRRSAKGAAAGAGLTGPAALSAPLASHKGEQLVTRVIDTMGLIKAHSNQIVALIKLVDGLALQSRILAQNAEDGAARQGSPGSDLGLVAKEVRALAQRAGTAAREIRLLTDDSADQADDGFELVDQAGKTMCDIVANVKRVSNLIHLMSQTPVAVVDNPLRHSAQLPEVNNVALVGHLTATAHGMQQKAEQVAHAVSLFKLGTLGEAGRQLTSATIFDLASLRKRSAGNRGKLPT